MAYALPRVVIASTATALACGSFYAYTVRQSIGGASALPITISLDQSQNSFSTSRTARELINPHGYGLCQDTRSVALRVPTDSEASKWSDEEILARFVQTFFGGAVLAPERTGLRWLGWRWTQFSNFKSMTEPRMIWNKHELSDKTLPPLSSIIFGAFQVLDLRIRDQRSLELTTKDGFGDTSYIDFGFGRDTGTFAGYHRFCVSRPHAAQYLQDKEDLAGKGNEIRLITWHGMTCDPTKNRPFRLDGWVYNFHLLYADYLFREGVARLQQDIENSGKNTRSLFAAIL